MVTKNRNKDETALPQRSPFSVTQKPGTRRAASSFRDPSGFVFFEDGVLYRQINQVGRAEYQSLMESGLYQELVEARLLIPHQEKPDIQSDSPLAFKILRPDPVEFISYPYEWSFSQYKDAALLTLAIQRRALKFGLTLKDCSAYNIQFQGGKPILIDTLSFMSYQEGEPWIAYRQFCQHFLAPLALMAYTDIRLSQLMRIYIDGIPLDLASRLLPSKTRLNFPLSIHIHLHARSQKHFADKAIDPAMLKRRISRQQLMGLLDSLETGVRKLHWKDARTEWSDYMAAHNYSPAALEHKKQIVERFVEQIQPATVWDVGANVGLFSRIASQRGIFTVAFDLDPGAVEQNYLKMGAEKERHLLPLLTDLTNPSPSIGWQLQERKSFLERSPAHAVFALALIHHLAIANNVPLKHLSEFFGGLCHWLIVEFIPKEDPQVLRMLATRKDIFPNYTQAGFEQGFGEDFTIIAREQLQDSNRVLYLMERKNP